MSAPVDPAAPGAAGAAPPGDSNLSPAVPATGGRTPSRTEVWPAAIAGLLALGVAVAIDFTLLRPQLLGAVNALRGELAAVRAQAEAASTTQAEALDRARQELASGHETIARAGKAVDEAQARMRAVEDLVGRNEVRVAQLAEALVRLSAERPRAELDWSLAEVEFLLFTAQQRLILTRDVHGAERILASADRRLAVLSEPALIPLREAIASDRNTLAAIQLPDTTGLAIYLGDLGQRVANLPLKPGPTAPFTDAPPPAGTQPAPSDAPTLLEDLWAEIRPLVVIREAARIDLAALDPATRALIRERLKLELAAARLAVLRHDTEQMRAAIDSAVRLLEEHFDGSAEAISSAVRALVEMRGMDLRPPIPETLAAAAAVQAALAAHARAPLPAPALAPDAPVEHP